MRAWLLIGLVVIMPLPSATMAQSTPEPLINPAGVPTTIEQDDAIVVEYYRFIPGNEIMLGAGGMDIVGEYTNSSDTQAVAPVLQFTCTDAKGSIYWRTTTYPVENFLAPGASGVFWAQITGADLQLLDGSEFLDIQLCTTGFSGRNAAMRSEVQLTITSNELEYLADDELYYGPIELTNNGEVVVEQPAIYAVSRDETDQVVKVSLDILDGPVRPGTLVRDRVFLHSPLGSSVELAAYEFGLLSVGCGS